MREIPVLIRAIPRIQTIARMPTAYERRNRHNDKDRVQLWVALAMIVEPVLLGAWWVL